MHVALRDSFQWSAAVTSSVFSLAGLVEPGRTAAWTDVGLLGAAVPFPSRRIAHWAGLVDQQLRDRPVALVALL